VFVGFTAARSAALRQVETALLLTALMTAAILLDLWSRGVDLSIS